MRQVKLLYTTLVSIQKTDVMLSGVEARIAKSKSQSLLSAQSVVINLPA